MAGAKSCVPHASRVLNTTTTKSQTRIDWAFRGALLGLFLNALVDVWAAGATLKFANAVGEHHSRLILEGHLVEYLQMRRSADLLRFAALLATAVPVVFLFSRAYSQLKSPRWPHTHAVTVWFVPVLQLFRPLQIAGEIESAHDGEKEAKTSPSWTLVFWWCLWLLSIGLLMMPASFQGETEAILHLRLRALAHGLSLCAAAVLAHVLLRWRTLRRFFEAKQSEPQERGR